MHCNKRGERTYGLFFGVRSLGGLIRRCWLSVLTLTDRVNVRLDKAVTELRDTTRTPAFELYRLFIVAAVGYNCKDQMEQLNPLNTIIFSTHTPDSMRGDCSWDTVIYEAVKMSSIKGLPTRGSDVTIVITRVHLHPLCELVEFWAKFSQEGAADYLSLAKDLQSPGNTFKELEGNPGDECLAQKDGIWYRSRIVSRNGSQYKVFLIDRGMTYSTTSIMLAWGKKEHFYLPPEVEFCVLANVLPVSLENRWSPMALEFLQSLSGRSVKAFVQNIQMPQRMVVLHIPCIAKQMYEMGFSRKLSAEKFQDFLFTFLQSNCGPKVTPNPLPTSMGMGELLHKKEMFMYPELQAGTVETVVITEVTNPLRIFCQLKVFSQELKKLSEQLTQCCDGRTTAYTVDPEMIGFPCAARGSDGKWYRSVIQHVFPVSRVVEVLNVDYGTKQIVQVENVRPLAAEFFRMPVVTYNCSLHGIIDKGVGWTTAQIEYLRALLLFKTVIVKFEYHSITEGVYYVTFYGNENANINNLFGSKENCLLQCEKTLRDYAIPGSGHDRTPQNSMKQAVEENKRKAQSLPVEDLSINSSHVAFVQYVSSPSEFWIQTENYTSELDKLMETMFDLYKDDLNQDMVQTPTVGLYCAAKAGDGEYYRATITEVGYNQVKVYLVDYGSSEMVDRHCIWTLPDELKKMPQLGLQCTLADIRPRDGKWSHSAIELFTKMVMDKALTVYVAARSDDGYVVQLTDPEAEGEKDLAKLMCAADFAENDKRKMSSQFAVTTTTQFQGQFTGITIQPQNTVGSVANGKEMGIFKKQMFSTGRILDVNVSYINSPNDFWCQNVHNTGHLNLLMDDLQAHYRNSEFQPFVETHCVACHPVSSIWLRAIIVHKHETPHVDVLFIDYGWKEKLSIFDLRRIEKKFCTLPGQAFRCSLLNPVNSTSVINDWTKEAVDRFYSFVKTAASNFVILKCTIVAVMYSEQTMFNIVDLETPFESICTSLVNLVKSIPPTKPLGSSFRLDTYYYSTHNVKTGTEEQVTLTSVNNVGHFYCQLKRNATVLEDLQMKVASLCERLQKVKLPSVFGTLCFAKFTDGQWYRGQIKATKPSILVHFVDYGDTLEVDKSDLLPVPKGASDIMSVPVQAVVCGLSDIPDNVSSAANSWFETSSTECEFGALIVAKEPDGKLLVELYQGKTQVNAKIKKLFKLEMGTEEPVVFQSKKSYEASVKPAQRSGNGGLKQAAKMQDPKQQSTNKNKLSVSNPCHMKNELHSVDMRSTPKPRQHVKENHQRKYGPLELYKPPHERHSNGTVANGTENVFKAPHSNEGYRNPPNDTKPKEVHSSPTTESWIESRKVPQTKIEKLPKLADLPPKSITSGMVADVYISHCNSPLSFYVQLVKEEDNIFLIADKLNDPDTIPKYGTIMDVQPGDLVQAEFADDSSWYRAVVREKQDNATVLVAFVDFGNTATVPLSKISRLHGSLLQLPMYSTHCMLSSAANLRKEDVLDKDAASAFESAIGGNGEKRIKCTFIKLSGSVWVVSLKDDGVEVECTIPTKRHPEVFRKDQELSEAKPNYKFDSSLTCCSLQFKQQALQEGQQLEVYITAITDAQTFWCHSADTEEMDQISQSVAGAGDAADSKDLDKILIGSPCIALFSDDQLWYRAEVLEENGDEVSLLFVDYGNICQVKLSDVRPIPPKLVQSPAQAFSCELEGFDPSEGSWESNAADKLSACTADQVLQLTVTKVTREEDKTKCLVQLECNGQVINQTMKKWWRYAKEPVSDPELERADSIVVPLEEEEDQIPADSFQIGNDYENTLDTESFVMPLEEVEYQMCSTFTDLQVVPSLKEQLNFKEINASPIPPEPSGVLTSDIAQEETVLYSSADDKEEWSLSCKRYLMEKYPEEEAVLDTTGPEDLNLLLDECFLGATDESGFTDSPFESPSKDTGDDSDTSSYFDSNQNHETLEVVPDARPASVTSAKMVKKLVLGNMTSEKMVPCLAFGLREKNSPVHVKSTQIADLLLLPSSDLPTRDLFGHEDEAAGGTLCSSTNDDTPLEKTNVIPGILSYDKETFSDLLGGGNTPSFEPQMCTIIPTAMGDMVIETPSFCEEACLDFCTDENVHIDDSNFPDASSSHLSIVAKEETDYRAPSVEVPCGQLIELDDADAAVEPDSYTYPSFPHFPKMSQLAEQLMCVVGEACVTDISAEQEQAAETTSSESLEDVPLRQMEYSSDETVTEDSFADESFEDQLSKITHLSLIIKDGSSVLGQLPEE